MSKHYWIFTGSVLLALLVGCRNTNVEWEEEVLVCPHKEGRTLTARLELEPDSAVTRTYLSGPVDGIYYPYWSQGDAVAVYADGINMADQFVLSEGEGTTTALFTGTLSGKHLVALYPYSCRTEKGLKDGILTLELPAEQEYVSGTFGNGAFPMLAVSETDELSFKNLCAVLKLSLTGKAVVNSIRFVAHDDKMVVSGKGSVKTDYESVPELVMSEGGAQDVTLKCGYLELDETEPTDFYIVIPAGTYKGGFSVEIKTFTGTVTRSTEKDVVFARSQFRAIPAFACDADGAIDPDNIPYNQIWYTTTTNGSIGLSSYWFDQELVSDEYKDGWRVITFSGPVSVVKGWSFNHTDVTSVRLPDSVTSIGYAAFRGSSITSFRTPEQLSFVDWQAFSGCTHLERIYGKWSSPDEKALILEDGTLVGYAIAATDEVLSIPDGVVSIGTYACEGNIHMRHLVLPEGLTTLGQGCFTNCSSLETVRLPASLISMETSVFDNCEELREFSGESELIANPHCLVGGNHLLAVAGKGLTDFVIPESVSFLSSLGNLKELRSLTFTSTIHGYVYAFLSGCDNMEFFYGPTVTSDHHCLILFGDNLVAVTAICPSDYAIPANEGIKSIGGMTFLGNRCIERLTIPDNVSYIEEYAFSNMPNLQTLILPASLSHMGNDLFDMDYALETIYARSVTPPSFTESDGAHIGHPGMTVYVPRGSEDLYKSTPGWAKYADYIQGYDYPDLEGPDYYISSDFSQDGKVTTLQEATEGKGINLVLMGDAFSDRQIADGTYATVVNKMMEAFFTEEPYASYRHLFNVYAVNVVSSTEGYEHTGQALSSWFGEGTQVGGDNSKCMEYAMRAVPRDEIGNTLIIVAMNSDAYAGTCWMFDADGGDYGSGTAVAYFPCMDEETLEVLVHHEAGGHGFAKLADEYAYESYGAIPEAEKEARMAMVPYGWWKNCDFTGDPLQVKWTHFLFDDRYKFDGLGCYEGGFTYWTGVWRPTENSIMRYNFGGFNAPSREAIWYRIHKLAYGEQWQYDYEAFVAYDAKNRKTSSSQAPARRNCVERAMEPTHTPVLLHRRWDE